MTLELLFLEFILYCIYIYFLLYIGVRIKPTFLKLFFFGAYVFISTALIYKNGLCTGFASTKYLFILVYSLCCIFIYLFIYRIYWKYKKYRYLLLVSPLTYFIFIKIMEKYTLKCSPQFNINYGKHIIITGLNLGKKILLL